MLSIFDAACEQPNAPALIEAGVGTTHAELAERAAAAAAWLTVRRINAASARTVAFVGASDRPALIVLHALIALGVPALLVHPRLTAREREELLAIGDAALFLDGDACRAAAQAAPSSDPLPPPPLDDERPLAVVCTSGTTGLPRGVVLSRRSFVASARASASNLGWRSDDRWLLGLGIAHVGGLGIVMRCLLARRAVVLPPPGPFDARAVIDCIAHDRVTLLSLVPTQLARLVDIEPKWQPPAHLRAVLLGGAPAPAALLERACERGVPVLTTYGLSEACSQVTTQRPGTPCGVEQGAGHPLPGVELRIADDEIQVRGPTLFSTYLGNDPAPLTDDGWLRTGDLGTLDAAGRLHVLGRRGDIIVTGGEKVHPLEVERVLEAFPSVAAACVFGLPDAQWGQIVAAAALARPGAALDLDALSTWARERLATFKRPRMVRVVASLPANAQGKLDRAAIKRAFLKT